MPDRISSIDVINSEANRERDAQARHFERLGSSVDVVALRTAYAAVKPHLTKLHVLDGGLRSWAETSRVIERKERRLMIGMALLGIAIVLISFSLVLR